MMCPQWHIGSANEQHTEYAQETKKFVTVRSLAYDVRRKRYSVFICWARVKSGEATPHHRLHHRILLDVRGPWPSVGASLSFVSTSFSLATQAS
jgi:hypothetical protein